MKSYINKIVAVLLVAFAVGFSSCINDLDVEPKDPNSLTAADFKNDPEGYLMQVMGKCYSGLAISGQGGPNGSSDISGLDGGTSQYTRALFMMNEFTTDEAHWIWPDEGVFDLVTSTWSKGNANIYGTYSRLYVHIAICNEFLRLVDAGNMSTLGIPVSESLAKTIEDYKLEARALRALSYYNAIDLFGNASFIDETYAAGAAPVQKTRRELYDWLAAELEDLVTKMASVTSPIYGRVGVDGVEALLCRLYLNAKVYTDGAVDGYALCSQHAQNIINRHQGGGFQNSGLANHYMYVFCGNNEEYMPGGANKAENEILWGIPYETTYIQPYGGTTFLVKANVANDVNIPGMGLNYGCNDGWTCMHAREQFSDKFESHDIRCSQWKKEADGFNKANTAFSTFIDGYAVVKFTNLLKGTNGEWSTANGGIYDPSGSIPARSQEFPDTDLPLIRLAEVYLMYAEANIVGGAGDAATALRYVNYIRSRAGVSSWTAADMTADNILDERCRELYWELVRRTDLIRHNKFTGSAYNWSWKNNVAAGASIESYRNLFPIPANVISAQPEFEQNYGY